MSISKYQAARNGLDQTITTTKNEGTQPANDQDRIGYGIISEVNEDTSQVKIKILTADGQVGDLISDSFHPLATPLSVIHLQFGALREGLVCRLYWKGKLKPSNTLVEVIGDGAHLFLKKKPATNKVNIGPYQIFSGGV